MMCSCDFGREKRARRDQQLRAKEPQDYTQFVWRNKRNFMIFIVFIETILSYTFAFKRLPANARLRLSDARPSRCRTTDTAPSPA
jgi:hypothetical protein